VLDRFSEKLPAFVRTDQIHEPMKKQIKIEGDNFLTLRKNTPYAGWELRGQNNLWELTRYENSKFVILADEDNVSPLNAYLQTGSSAHPPGTADVYGVTNDTHIEPGVLIHQAFFKLSKDGNLRELGLQAQQIEEIIVGNADIFPKGEDWITYFLIESGNGIYPISVRPFRHDPELYEIGLESLSDLTSYSCEGTTFFVVR
jgi:hypothetical protein